MEIILIESEVLSLSLCLRSYRDARGAYDAYLSDDSADPQRGLSLNANCDVWAEEIAYRVDAIFRLKGVQL